MKPLTKQVVRSLIIEKIREVTTLELHDLSAKYDLDSFSVAECFDNEAFRVEKFFNFPHYDLPE
jgi:hypothetical protein